MVPAVQHPNTLDDVTRLGGIFRRSGYFKNVNDEAQAITKILYGMELGFSPVVSMMGIYIVDGKPALSGNLLGALVKRSNKYDFIVKVMNEMECSIQFRQMYASGRSADIGTSTFTMEDARMAGLTSKDSWRKYPKAMLYNRALSAGVRAFCPDVSVSPIYVPEELGASVTEDGEVISISETATAVVHEPVVLKSESPVKLPDVDTTPAPEPADVEPPQEESPYITSRQRSYIAKRFRESLSEDMQPHVDEVRHDVLATIHQSGLFKSKLVDDYGNPTSEFILTSEYEAIGKEMVRMAKAL